MGGFNRGGVGALKYLISKRELKELLRFSVYLSFVEYSRII